MAGRRSDGGALSVVMVAVVLYLQHGELLDDLYGPPWGWGAALVSILLILVHNLASFAVEGGVVWVECMGLGG